MTITKYSIEIFEPGSVDTSWVAFSSATPFMTINVGDIVNPSIWPGSQSPMKVLRAIGVEHVLHEVDGKAKHHINVYTEEIEGTREARVANVQMSTGTESQMNQALDAIHDHAAALLLLDISENLRTGIDRILALARYKFPVLGPTEGVIAEEDSGDPN